MLPGLVVSAAALGTLLYFTDLEKLAQALRLADYRLVLAALLIILAWLGVRSLLWQTLLKGQVSVRTLFWTINEGYLLNNLLPFRLGEVGRAYLVSGKSQVSFWEVLSSIFIERILDLTFAAGLFLVTLPLAVSSFVGSGAAGWQGSAVLVTGGIVLLVLIALYLAAKNADWVQALANRLTSSIPPVNRLVGRLLPPVLDGLAVLTDRGLFLRAIGLSAINWALGLLQYYVLLKAFFPQGEFLWSAFTLAVAALGIAAPSSPAALGVYEAAVVGALSLFGLDVSTALAMAVTTHLLQIVLTGVLGAAALAQEGQSLADLYRRVRRLRPQSGGSHETQEDQAS